MKSLTCILIASVFFLHVKSQNIGIGTTVPHASAALEVSATDRGMLVPRLTSAQRVAIATPAPGLLVFDTSTQSFWFYGGSSWTELTSLSLPYSNETTGASPAFSIKNNGNGVGIRGISTSGWGVLAQGLGAGLAGVAMRADNSHAAGIGIHSSTNSLDANTVLGNAGTGDIIRGFSGPGAGTLVFRLLNNGSITTTGKMSVGSSLVPVAALEVTGAMKLMDGTQAAGRVLTSDASGLSSWIKPTSLNTGFQVKRASGSISIPNSIAQTTVVFDHEIYDDASAYNPATGVFTCLASGVYHFNVKVQWNGTVTGATPTANVYLLVNAEEVEQSMTYITVPAGSGYVVSMPISTTIKLNAGDLVKVNVSQTSSGALTVGTVGTSFSGHRVY